MGKYVLLLNWTDQGIKNVKDTIKRAESFRSYLEKRGGKVSDILYTFGQYDIVAIAELPSDEIAMSVSLGTGALGNVRVTTLKAFNLDETRRIVDELK
ncbi:MAG TPA: GYD domain-containing protein [Nitrososphaeraceae archaeon]|nr:GYD domain-containing protein [Nitrososphaeraceae archaeon]